MWRCPEAERAELTPQMRTKPPAPHRQLVALLESQRAPVLPWCKASAHTAFTQSLLLLGRVASVGEGRGRGRRRRKGSGGQGLWQAPLSSPPEQTHRSREDL